jgi:hypothetical protein
VPAEQTLPVGHVVLQSTQWLGSTFGSTQTPPQFFVPSPHVVVHLPLEQSSPSLQTVPHAPQLS